MKIFRKIFSNPRLLDIYVPALSQGCFLDAGEGTGEARRRGTLLPDADDPVGHLRSRNGVVRHVREPQSSLGTLITSRQFPRQRQLAQYIQLGHRP